MHTGIEDSKVKSMMLWGMWITVSLVISSVYKSILMSMLIAPKVNIPFSSFEDLVTQTEVAYKMPAFSFVEEASKVSADELEIAPICFSKYMRGLIFTLSILLRRVTHISPKAF